jgi:hypothetical protein
LSLGVSALSAAITRMRSMRTPITSATTCVAMVLEPWPMSEAPVSKVMPPSKSSLRLTVACGSPVQCLGVDVPETKCEQAMPRPRPLGMRPRRSAQPEAALTFSRHSGRP